MGYRIKTVARLTGVPRNTLLAWERRYELVSPARLDNGYREYSDSDIASLLSVKRLLDQGYKVSEAVNLIREARETAQGDLPVPGSIRVALLHPTLHEQLTTTAGEGGLPLRIVYSAASADGLLAMLEAAASDDDAADTDEPDDAAEEESPADLLVAELSLLGIDPVTTLQGCMAALGTTQALVTYQFATYAVLQRLINAGVRLVSATARVSVLHQAIREQLALQQVLAPAPALPASGDHADAEDGVPRRFSDRQLARLRELRSSVDCECPNHVASLVTALVAFEAYSRDCESQSPDDARLHARLAAETGHAREIMEGLLLQLCEQDGIAP